MGIAVKILIRQGFQAEVLLGTLFAYFSDMKGKTLYYCPRDEDMLLFEEVYDERLDFAYQPPREIPCVCPKCGFILFKKDCLVIEELFAHPGAGSATGETR